MHLVLLRVRTRPPVKFASKNSAAWSGNVASTESEHQADRKFRKKGSQFFFAVSGISIKLIVEFDDLLRNLSFATDIANFQ